MDWLNLHHLYYFWTVVREGSIAAASRRLDVGRPSISAQIKTLEISIGTPLFERRGKYLELTETGKLVHSYAEDMFRVGRELAETLRGGTNGRPTTLRVGVADVLAKIVSFELLQAAFDEEDRVALHCREEHPNKLFAELAVHELDLVLCDHPLPPSFDVRARTELLGESKITLFAQTELATKLAEGFPESLAGAPFLMPPRDSAVRRSLEAWFEDTGIRPEVVSEFGDSALMKMFGRAGHGAFPAPSAVASEVETVYDVKAIGTLDAVRDRVWAITPERRNELPAVRRILDHASSLLYRPENIRAASA